MGELARRVLVALVAAPLAITMVYVGELPLALFLGVVGGVGAWELYRMARHGGVEALEPLGIILAAAFPLIAHADRLMVLRSPAALGGVVFVALLGVSIWARGTGGRPLESVAVTVFGALYAGAMLAFGYSLRHHRFVIDPAAGTALVMFPVILTWASDIGAYFVGRAFGKAKLIPSISPGKTRAGAVGAIVLTMGIALLYNSQVLRPWAQLALAPWTALVFGLLVSVAAQIGDLAESLLKREAGVKDSSHLLPGHGGILDRLDSLYFVLPVAYLVLGRLVLAAPQ
ncbi:MAG: phosphatidate cytidylyltransferase [Gemmatimonadetes bacterium]|nr:phosphatidate cytidylyltransferase [Gemmatimonadota bacterium]MCC6772813.1 phosphatidate cytidylyltransferase [Gemmatimonadaceae bacterium]